MDDAIELPTDPSTILNALHRLEETLNQLKDDVKQHKITYFSKLPPVVQQAYDLADKGAQLIHATSTKYTLLSKLDQKEHERMLQDLLRGAQWIGTSCLLLSGNHEGCAACTQKYILQACRGIMRTLVHLVELYVDNVNKNDFGEQEGAQRTGRLWQACNQIIEKRIPKGNRNAMRRDLFIYQKECMETMEEFQQVLELGVASENEDAGDDAELTFDEFLQDDQPYTEKEAPIVQTCLAIIKCTRGSLNLTLQALEGVDLENKFSISDESSSADDNPQNSTRQLALNWMSELHTKACEAGVYMTELGASLYQPIQVDDVKGHVDELASRVTRVIEHVLDATLEDGKTHLELPEETMELAGRLQTAILKRKEEAVTALR